MAPPGNQAVNGENKHQPDVSEETGLLDSKVAYDPRGPLYSGVDVADVWVDNKGLIYLSGYNSGLEILEFTG